MYSIHDTLHRIPVKISDIEKFLLNGFIKIIKLTNKNFMTNLLFKKIYYTYKYNPIETKNVSVPIQFVKL